MDQSEDDLDYIGRVAKFKRDEKLFFKKQLELHEGLLNINDFVSFMKEKQ